MAILERKFSDEQMKNEFLLKQNYENGIIIFNLNQKVSNLEKQLIDSAINDGNVKRLRKSIDVLIMKHKKKNENFRRYIIYQNEILNKLARTLFTVRAIVSTVDTSVLVPKGLSM